MNTLTSVVLLSLLVAFSQGLLESKVVQIPYGSDYVLVGPRDPPVQWFGGGHFTMFCNGSKTHLRNIRHSCNEQNLTLLSVGYGHRGDYYGYRHDNTDRAHYKVIIQAPPPVTRKPLSKIKYVNVTMGQNLTLSGPPGTPVTWLGEKHKLCEGKNVFYRELNHTCTEKDLILLFVNRTHNGPYIGYNKDGTDREQYEVSVLDLMPIAGQGLDSKIKKEQKIPPKRKSKDKVKEVNFPTGSNQTLIGPPGQEIDWHVSSNDGQFKKLCETQDGKHSCHGQNITILNISRSDEGSYYGSSNDASTHYKVTVYDKSSFGKPKIKIDPYTTKGTTTENHHEFELQQGNDESDDQKQIPSTTVAIVVGVIAGFITIIIVILCYICCRKRPRAYNHMVDPLLSFSY